MSRSAARSPGCCRSPRSGLVAGLWLTRRAPRTDGRRALFVLFGVWAVVHFVIFGRQQGTFHPYYVSALAPAVAVLAGARAGHAARLGAPVVGGRGRARRRVVASAWVAVAVLARTPDFAPWLRTLIPVATAVALYGAAALRRRRCCRAGRWPSAPSRRSSPSAPAPRPTPSPPSGERAERQQRARRAGLDGRLRRPGGRVRVAAASADSDSALIEYLLAHQGSAKYLVAVSGSQSAAPIILATGKPVVTIGGFTGSDPAPTVSQLEAMVKSGELKYVLIGDGGGMGGGRGGSTRHHRVGAGARHRRHRRRAPTAARSTGLG